MQMISPSRSYKERVQESFSKHASTYDSAAALQFMAARLTAKLIEKNVDLLPAGPILEVGCGTGMLSSLLPAIFPDRQIIFSDISPDMVLFCKNKLMENKEFRSPKESRLSWMVLDAEELKTHSEYAAIVSNFSIQWFFQPFKGISRLMSALRADGALFFSLPGADSCPEWKNAAEKIDVPFTRNPLPSYEEMIDFANRMGLQYELQQRVAEESYNDAKAMLHSLRELGASTQKGDMRLSCGQLRKLLKELDGSGNATTLSYQVLTGFYRRI
jgi:malonyl-CoA O-methyltransferase